MTEKKALRHLIFLSSIVAVSAVVVLRVMNAQSSLAGEPSATLVDGATITGVVKFPQDYPEREKITITKDQAVCGAFQYSEHFVVSEQNHGLANVVVSVQGLKGDVKPTGSALTMDQNKCRYVPHVQAVPVGSKLQILNSDGILHNVHAYFGSIAPKNTVFNKAQPKFLKKISQTLEKAGTYYYKCDVHDHMHAYIAVFDHPYYAVTDDQGAFTISNVPAGKYKIQAWHEMLGLLEKEVEVEAGKGAVANFDILPNE